MAFEAMTSIKTQLESGAIVKQKPSSSLVSVVWQSFDWLVYAQSKKYTNHVICRKCDNKT